MSDNKISENHVISYVIHDLLELNLSYMPFINDGGLFIPTPQTYHLGDRVLVDLQLPGKSDIIKIEGKVVWITPENALYLVAAGIGIQFIGADAQKIRSQIEAILDSRMEIGGYTYGITDDIKKGK